MKRNEQVLWAMTELGDDLIDGAQQYRPPKSIWRQLLPVAACLAVVLGLWQGGKQLRPAPAEPLPSSVEEEVLPPVENVPAAKAAYILDVSATAPRMIAVDQRGGLVAEAERLEFITDRATGERLAILATPVWGADSDWKSAERIVYDLFGTELCRLHARKIQCVGDVAAVTYYTGNVSVYRKDGTLMQENLEWAVAYGDCMAVKPAEGPWTQQYYGPDGTLLVDLTRDGWNQFDTHYGEQTLFYKWSGSHVGLADLNGNWVVEPRYTKYSYVNETCVRCLDAAGDWVLVSLETGEVLYRIGAEERYVEPYGPLLFCMGDDGSRWEDWYGNVIVPTAAQVRAVDDNGDQTPELLWADDGNGTTVYYEPDGTRRLQVTGALELETLSSRRAVGIWETEGGQTELRLVDLTTGETFGGGLGNYLEVDRVLSHGADKELISGTFYAWYRAETGEWYADLLDESGNVLLEQLRRTWDGAQPHIGDGVFRVEGGYRHIDGTWLYRG